jgi:hypothetical protein
MLYVVLEVAVSVLAVPAAVRLSDVALKVRVASPAVWLMVTLPNVVSGAGVGFDGGMGVG